MNENTSSRQHYLFALLLFMAGLLIILIFLTVRSQADSNDSDTSANIENSTPSLGAVTISLTDGGGAASTVDLTDNSTKNVFVYGNFTDTNGCDEVTTSPVAVRTVLYASTAAGTSACSASNTDCYIVSTSTCTLSNCSGGTDQTGSYSCPISVYFYATPTIWTASVTASDGTATSTAGTVTTTVNQLAALDISNTDIAYGSLSIGATSSEQVVPTDNTGNITIDVRLTSTALTCTDGVIPVGQQRVSTTSGGSYYHSTALDTASTTFDINLVKRTQGASSTQNFNFLLAVPDDGTGYSGICTGEILFEGIAG